MGDQRGYGAQVTIAIGDFDYDQVGWVSVTAGHLQLQFETLSKTVP